MQILGNREIYFLTVLLPPELERQILAFKQHFAGIYASRMALLPPGHITLVETFSLLESDLKRALNTFSRIATELAPFSTALKNFSGFPEHTVCINVLNQQPFKVLAKRLNAALRQELNLSSKNGGGAVGNPHLTIAYRYLTPENYRAAMHEFKNRVFEALLEVRSFHLMKQAGAWKSVREFHLTGAEDYAEKQRLLFP